MREIILSSAEDMQTVADKVQTIQLLFEYTTFSSNLRSKKKKRNGVNDMAILMWACGATKKR